MTMGTVVVAGRAARVGASPVATIAAAHQLDGQRGQPLQIAFSKPVLDLDRAAVDITQFAQRFDQRLDWRRRMRPLRADGQQPNALYAGRLLSAQTGGGARADKCRYGPAPSGSHRIRHPVTSFRGILKS